MGSCSFFCQTLVPKGFQIQLKLEKWIWHHKFCVQATVRDLNISNFLLLCSFLCQSFMLIILILLKLKFYMQGIWWGMQKTEKISHWISTNICGLGQEDKWIFWIAVRDVLRTLRRYHPFIYSCHYSQLTKNEAFY